MLLSPCYPPFFGQIFALKMASLNLFVYKARANWPIGQKIPAKHKYSYFSNNTHILARPIGHRVEV